jgi:hypothetical protein
MQFYNLTYTSIEMVIRNYFCVSDQLERAF